MLVENDGHATRFCASKKKLVNGYCSKNLHTSENLHPTSCTMPFTSLYSSCETAWIFVSLSSHQELGKITVSDSL